MEPYKGLRPYEEKDRDNFFGRDEEKCILVDKIRAYKLNLLFAASGVGKSSLLRAAVIPELRTPALENLDVVYCNDWVAEPVETLKQAIIGYLHENSLLAADDNTLNDISELPELFENAVLFTSEPLVIMLDQFEEFFNYQRYNNKHFKPFIRQLAAAINDRDTPTTFVISMREDFALELNAFKPDLPTMLFDNFYRLEKLPLENAKRAIAAPVEKIGFHYEDGLLDAMLLDLSQREQIERFGRDMAAAMEAPPVVEPPHLQIVCSQLWDIERNNPAKMLSRAAYDKRGAALGLLGGYFQVQIETLSAAEKKFASAAFNYLVNKHGTKMAYPLPDLSKLLAAEEKALGATLDKLGHARILRRQLRKEVPWYELYHDIFSKSIYVWNEKYKTRQRLLKYAKAGGIAVSVAVIALLGYDYWDNASHQHFRLSAKVGVSDTIELWQGRADPLLDWAGQVRFVKESAHLRGELEADKLFNLRPVQNTRAFNPELIERRPLATRLHGLLDNGGFKNAALCLANTGITSYNPEAEKLMQSLVQSGSETAYLHLAALYGEESDKTLKDNMLTALDKTLAPPSVYLSLPQGIKAHAVGNLRWFSWETGQIQPVLLAALKDEDSAVRQSAVQALSVLGNSEALPNLTVTLKDEDSKVRNSAVQTLETLGNSDALPELITAVKDEDSNVRNSAVQALKTLGSQEALPALSDALKDQDKNVRQSAAQALGALGSLKALPDLITALKDQDENVRQSAAQALGALGSLEALPTLNAALKDQNLNVRNSAAQALGNLGALSALSAALKDPDWSVRSSVVGVLGARGSFESLPALSSAALKDSDGVVRSRAVRFLGMLGSFETLSTLSAALKDPDWNVRIKAAKALSKLGSPEALPALSAALKDQNSYVSSSAAEALGALGNLEALPALSIALKDQQWDVRESATKALGTLGSLEALPALNAALKDQNWIVRSSAAKALGALGSLKALPALNTALKDSDSDVREGAVKALGALGSLEALPALTAALKDSDYDVREGVARALGTLGSMEALPALTATLKDGDENVRKGAAQALGALGSLEALPALTATLKDQSSRVRNSAMQALGMLGSLETLSALTAALKDQNSTIR
ncbi:MAG: HEAT repeat domain-containing protein, partial [Gammaproteobacteria bacterium]|nr:HEAT repeat domain-containing protein [Gammaproteobacteria bacterium]